MPSPSPLAIYARLRAAFGPQHWWPAETPWEVIVGAILTQSAAWTNVEKAIANLRQAELLTVAGIAATPVEEMARLVYPSGYYNAKARKLKAFAAHVTERHGSSLDALLSQPAGILRPELLAIHGVGPETADSIILYAAGLPVFVVDAYTRRIAARLGLCGSKATYDELQVLFTDGLPRGDAALFNEFHALFVTLGKDYCRKRPLCVHCPLASDLCPTGAAALGDTHPPKR